MQSRIEIIIESDRYTSAVNLYKTFRNTFHGKRNNIVEMIMSSDERKASTSWLKIYVTYSMLHPSRKP